MALTETQIKSLKAKLKRGFVKRRESDGSELSYIGGWHAIAEANRIFGFDSWDRQTLTPKCHWAQALSGETICFYSTKVRVTVRAGETVTLRDGVGTGFGRARRPELAHDIALKAAETDATKRALATFGNPFGLALYDRHQTQVTRPRSKSEKGAKSDVRPDWFLIEANGHVRRFENASDLTAEALRQINVLTTVNAAYDFWSRNSGLFGKLKLASPRGGNGLEQLALALKERVRQLTQPQLKELNAPSENRDSTTTSAAGKFLIPKERRIRDASHLAFVANQPCLICGRRPAQAHLLRFAQPRAMALKVSDEYTVPMCNIHHDQLHRHGDERAFWAKHGIRDPLKFAARLWDATRAQRNGIAAPSDEKFDPETEAQFNEPSWTKVFASRMESS